MKTSVLELGTKIPELFCIEMPCFVRNQQDALNMLGGNYQVERSFQMDDSAPIQCRLPGDNLLRPNLMSTTQNKRSVVLKIRRKKAIQNGKCISSSIIGFEIAGLIKKTVAFTNPADFQFLPSFSNASAYSTPLQQSCPNGSLPLEIVPHSISRIDFEKRLQFISFLHVPKRTKKANPQSSRKSTSELNNEDQEGKESDIETDEKRSEVKNNHISSDEGEDPHKRSARKRNPDSGHTLILKFGDAIPSSHPLGLYPPRWIAKRNQTGEEFRGLGFIDRLKELFEKIPVLKRSQIIDFLGIGSRQHLFKECLPYVAFTYSNGPFSNLWIRYGYDPTAHVSSRIFQLLNCRFLPQYLINLSDKLTEYIGRDNIHRKMVDLDRMEIVDAPEEFSHRFIDKGAFARLPISIFGYICKHQVSFQVHTLSDKQLFTFVQQMQVTNVCSEQTGWFTDEAAVVFRNFISKYLEQRIEVFLKSPLVFATKPPVPQVLAKSEDQTLIASRLQQFVQDYDTFAEFEDAWYVAHDHYPLLSHHVASAPIGESFPEETQNRKTIFWLLKYSAAAEKSADMLDRVLLPSLQPMGSQEWTSTKRKNSGWHEAHDKIRDKNALLAASVAKTSGSGSQSQLFTSPLFAPSASLSSNTKRNVRFAPTIEPNQPMNTATSAVPGAPPILQFTLNSDAIAKSTGFGMLDSDSGDEY